VSRKKTGVGAFLSFFPYNLLTVGTQQVIQKTNPMLVCREEGAFEEIE
jgi:hypothetical protein